MQTFMVMVCIDDLIGDCLLVKFSDGPVRPVCGAADDGEEGMRAPATGPGHLDCGDNANLDQLLQGASHVVGDCVREIGDHFAGFAVIPMLPANP